MYRGYTMLTKTLVLPIAGKSERYGGFPKWQLRHPLGGIMLSKAIGGIYEQFDRVIVIMLEEQATPRAVEQIFNNFTDLFGDLIDPPVLEICRIEKSNNQPDTVFQGLQLANAKKPVGSFFVKDCDNYFQVEEISGNCVAYAYLEDYPEVEASNKSYIAFDDFDHISNIVEKKVISSKFCVGGYGFASYDTFIEAYRPSDKSDYHLSHLIYTSMLLDQRYTGIECKKYLDWGTRQDWEAYTRQFATLFVDLDGVLCFNSAPDYVPFHGDTAWMEKNIAYLKSLDQDKIKIWITTSRPNYMRDEIVHKLIQDNIPFEGLITGLPHAQRILVNDIRSSSDRSSAIAINCARDCDNHLAEELERIL
jgi:hypothetical protein